MTTALPTALFLALGLALPAGAQPLAPSDSGGGGFDTLATLPAGASLQGIDVTADGTVYLSQNTEDAILRFTPDGALTPVAKLPIHPHGVVKIDGGFVVTGQVNRPGADPAQSMAERFANLDGRVLRLNEAGRITASIALGANTFPNGIARLDGDKYLVADSMANVLWLVDIASGSVEAWSRDPFVHAEPSFPGANGIKVSGGWVYVSNTSKQQVGRIRIGRDGRPDGAFAILGPATRVDDITVATDGTVYAATHGAVARVSPDGRTATLFADAPGGSALMLARDGKSIYALTDNPLVGGVRGDTYLLRLWLQ